MNSPLFIETIRFADGQWSNLAFHNARLNHTRWACFDATDKWDLSRLLSAPQGISEGIYKCRVTYGETIEKVEFEQYQPRLVTSLRLVEEDAIIYDFKFQNRTALNRLFEKKANADDVLIIKQGFITDTSYANVVFWNGKDWLTPHNPLLKGTRRAQLLQEGIIREQEIRARDLIKYSHARLINAMLDFETTPLIDVQQIGF